MLWCTVMCVLVLICVWLRVITKLIIVILGSTAFFMTLPLRLILLVRIVLHLPHSRSSLITEGRTLTTFAVCCERPLTLRLVSLRDILKTHPYNSLIQVIAVCLNGLLFGCWEGWKRIIPSNSIW